MRKEKLVNIRLQLCNRIAQGESLRDICGTMGMPSISTVFNWLMPGSPNFDSEFLDQYRVARLWQTDSFIEQIISLSTDESLSAESKKIQIDALKTAASKLEARKYGAEKPRQITVKVVYESQTSTSSTQK